MAETVRSWPLQAFPVVGITLGRIPEKYFLIY
jgi:hypothetical protein